MEAILTDMVTSISEFRGDMQGTLKRSKSKAFAVLSNNKPSFYVISPEQYKLVAEIIADLEIAELVKSRIESAKTNAVSVNIDEI
jgi:antitoxin StbD